MIVHRLKPAATTDLKGLLVRASSGVFAVNAVGSLCLLGAHFLIARLFGSETYGQYVYVLNWVALLSLLGMLGFDTATLRFVPEYRAKGEAALLGGYLKSSAAFVLAASLGVSALLAAAVWWVDPGPSLKAAFLVGCLMLPLYTGMQLRCAQIQAFNRAALAQVPQRILRPVLFVAVAGVAVFLLSAKLSAARLLLVETAIVGGLFLLTWGISGRIAAGERPTETSALPRDWIRTSASLLFISGVFVILNRSDVIMIGFLIDTLHAGIYSAAARMGELMLFTLTAVNAVVAPLISQLHAADRHAELQKMLRLAAKAIFATALPILCVLTLWGREALGLLGTDFPAGYPSLVLIALGHMANALAGSVGFLMMMTGHQGLTARILAGAAALNVVLNLLLIPRYGILGAAVATSLTTLVWNAAMLHFVLRRLRLNPTLFPFPVSPVEVPAGPGASR